MQASAAELQTIMTTTSGVLSALTTGYWGTYGMHARILLSIVISVNTLPLQAINSVELPSCCFSYSDSCSSQYLRSTLICTLLMSRKIFRDLVFIITSQFSRHLYGGHYLLILGPIFEGSLGSWASFNAVINAYISDCSASGSRCDLHNICHMPPT